VDPLRSRTQVIALPTRKTPFSSQIRVLSKKTKKKISPCAYADNVVYLFINSNKPAKEEFMETLVIDRSTPIDALFSFMGAQRVKIEMKKTGRASISPVIDPDDYDNDTDYLSAIPGMAESIMAASASPRSKDIRSPEDWI
jgi:hypothetical protein